MPRFFFHVFGDAEPAYIDEIGGDLPDRAAAWREATMSVGQSIRDLDGRLRPGNGLADGGTDERRKVIFVLCVLTAELG
jgi:hypothetical protein